MSELDAPLKELARLHVQNLSERHRAVPATHSAPPYATDGAQATEQTDGLTRGVAYRIVYGRAAVDTQGLPLLTGCFQAGLFAGQRPQPEP